MDSISAAGNQIANILSKPCNTGTTKKGSTLGNECKGNDKTKDKVSLSDELLEDINMPESKINAQEADTSRSIRG
ncbi:MAG: hypothetical protein K8T10_17595 [Candidatus Eremiobacteraeota bacterium]|nr:hypothetical protein [Candidatus Eremiobacteraeota bacterium]